MSRRARPEPIPRQQGHALLVQQALGERLGAEPAAANIKHHEHAADRPMDMNARAAPQRRADPVTPLSVDLTHPPYVYPRLVQCHASRMHDELRQAEQHAHHQCAEVLREQRRADHPADPPATHRMGLGQAADRHAALGHAWQAQRTGRLTFVQQRLVDIVADQPQIMLPT